MVVGPVGHRDGAEHLSDVLGFGNKLLSGLDMAEYLFGFVVCTFMAKLLI